jgi:hypothetical protein
LNADKIDAGYRLFWTKLALTWDAPRRAAIASEVAAVIAAPDFEGNALERRYSVAGLDDDAPEGAAAHSGASLVALGDVLRALDAFEDDEDDEADTPGQTN